MNIMDIARATAPFCKTEVVGIRPGEKLHEQMINEEDALHTFEYEDYYVILPAIHSGQQIQKEFETERVPEASFSSDKNSQSMTVGDLRNWIS